MKYERITKHRDRPLTMSMWAGDGESLKIYNRLAELEDKIEAGTLIEIPEEVVIYTPNVVLTTEERAEEMRPCNEERKEALKEFADEFKRRYFFMMTTHMKYPIYQCTEEEFDRLVKEISETYGVSMEDEE